MRLFFLITLALCLMMPLFGTSLQYSKPNPHEANIRFELPGYAAVSELSDGKQVNKLKVTAASEDKWQENLSGLPQLEKWVYLPDGFDALVSLENSDVISKENFLCDTAILKNGLHDTQDWLDVSQPVIFRGNRIMSICVKPFHYNAQTKQLTTLNRADIRIQFTPSNIAGHNDRLLTPTTVDMLNSICINRDEIRTANQKPGSYVIFYNGTTLTNIIQQLADWKHQKGYDVRMVNTPTIGNNTTAIHNYLQTAYDTWDNPPEFVLILGRATTGTYNVPTYTEYYNFNTPGDYQYTLLDGDDIVPDAYIGRLTFASTDELQTAVNKILQYEKMQSLSASNWLNKSFLLGDVYQSGESCQTTITYVKGLLQNYNPDVQVTETYSGSFPSQISAALNSGVGTYWYRGHGEMSGWSNSDIANLNNTGKYPFISYVTCFTGRFTDGAQISQAEKFMRVGTPTLPKGAIGVIGASCETHTCLNNILTGGFAYGLYNEGITQCGPTLLRGKLALMANYPQNPASYLNQNFQSFNLFGDPALDVWLKPVSDINVTVANPLYAAGGNVSIHVSLTDNTPVEGAWVCFTKGTEELFVSGYTDADGVVVLPYGALTSGAAMLTVTKPQHRPYQLSFNVDTSVPTVTLHSIPALNQCYAGTGLTFPISITNNIATTLTNVTGTLTTTNADVTVPINQANFGSILAGDTATSQSGFQILLDSEMPKGEAIYLFLSLVYDGGGFVVPIVCAENGADFSFQTVAFGNNVLNQGTNQLSVSLLNNSPAAITGLQSVLESTNPFLTIQNPSQSLGNVEPNAIVAIPANYTIQVSDSLQEGVTVRLNLRLFNSGGFVQMLTIDKKIGTPTTNDMTGPDNYGYICYGPGDNGNVPYNWIEIDPSLGGTGTNLNLSDTDTEGSGDYSTVSIPFQFRFYGKSYTQLTICSNGFIMPGNQGSIEWMNWQIPGPMVPRPLIAPFWDDLLTDYSSRVLYKYDASLNAMIIQWQNLPNKYSSSLRETFQTVLYDPAYQLTPTGDSPILFQYKVFYNVDGGNYGTDYIDHGQYASVGIADHTGLNGLGYTFNNQYPATAQILANQTTLYFTTLPNYQSEANPIVWNCQITEVTGNGNGQADFGEQLNLGLVIKNTGLGSIMDSQVTLTSTDPYVTILQNQASLPALFNNQQATINPPFGIQIAQNCPNLHILHFNLHIQNSQYDFDLQYELVVHALQFSYDALAVTDANNNFPEPGETVQVTFNLHNLSLLPAQNLIVSFTPPAGVVIIPAIQTITIDAVSTQSLSFQVALDNTLAQGNTVDLGLHLTITGVYDSLMAMSVLVGVPVVFLNTGFEESNIYTVLQSMFNVTMAPAQYIHTTGHEAQMNLGNGVYSFIMTYPVQNIDLIKTRIKFTWYNANPEAYLILGVMYPDDPNLLPLVTSSGLTTTPQTITYDVDTFPISAEYATFILFASSDGTNDAPIIVDDLSINIMHHAPGIITGHVNLDMYPELVSQVSLYQRYSVVPCHPDAEGNYQMTAYQGQNVIYAVLDYFIDPLDSLVVNVTGGQTSANNDFSLQRICAPINLQYTFEGNTIHLNWDVEGQDTAKSIRDNKAKKDRYLIPDHYKLYFRCNSFNFQYTSNTESFSRVLTLNGSYQIFVQAVYIFNGQEETFSDSSNVITFAFTPNPDEPNIPVIFALNQNSPNPFNPSNSTQISFALPEKSLTSLNIYNLKGQLVRTLINADYAKGKHSMDWNGLDNNGLAVSSGIYYYRLKWNNKELTRKMILLK